MLWGIRLSFPVLRKSFNSSGMHERGFLSFFPFYTVLVQALQRPVARADPIETR